MRPSKFSFFACLLLIASLALNWYLIQQHGLDSNISELITNKSSKTNHETLQQEKVVKNQSAEDKKINQSLTDLQKLFDAEAYEQAWFELSQSTLHGVNTLKQNWIKTCIKWLKEEPNNTRIDRFIEAGFIAFPGDFQLRLLNSQKMFSRQMYIQAIDELYALLAESDVTEDNELDSRIKAISQQRIKDLTEQQEWQELFEFTERLLWHDKTNIELTFIHAQALAKLDRFSEAKSKLYYIANDVKYGNRANALIDKIDQTLLNNRLDRKSISLSTKGSHHIVRGLIDNYVPVSLMIDTGASLTTISESAFNNLQKKSTAIFIREQQFNTAGGLINAPVYRVSSFRVDDFEVFNIDLAVMDLETGSDSDGLLGMNFLSNFDFKIDQQHNVLVLAPRYK